MTPELLADIRQIAQSIVEWPIQGREDLEAALRVRAWLDAQEPEEPEGGTVEAWIARWNPGKDETQ